MSHFTKIKTKINSEEYLKRALSRMKLGFTEGKHTITQYGRSEKAEIKVDNAVGFSRQQDGTFAMVGDFYHSRNPKLRGYYGRGAKFTQDLNTAYAIEQTKNELEMNQFYCTENEEGTIGNDGKIRMVFESDA